jgi:hypothetical protein
LSNLVSQLSDNGESVELDTTEAHLAAIEGATSDVYDCLLKILAELKDIKKYLDSIEKRMQ